MIFEFLKYLKPVWYFNLRRNNEEYVFPKLDAKSFERDVDFQSGLGQEYYASYKLLTFGMPQNFQNYSSFGKVSVYDNYVFLRKVFNVFWVYYVLFFRIMTLKNPIIEIKCFLKTRKIKRSNTSFGKDDEYLSFDSSLVKDEPLVSIIIPTLNRYEYLSDVLLDLERQNYKNVEVIIVDQSSPFNESFYDKFDLKIRLVHQKERALWLARNHAVKIANGDFVLLFDDDSRVKSDWVFQHMKTLDFFNADASSGISISKVGDKVPDNYSFFRISDQLDTGNVLLKKEVFYEIGFFDRQFEGQRQGDGEFGLRLYLNNMLNISNPYAKRLHLKVGSGGLREMGTWDGLRPKKLFAPRPVPSILYSSRKYYGNSPSIFMLLKSIPFSLTNYEKKGDNKYKILSLFKFLIGFPFWFILVLRSWNVSTKMLKKGALGIN